MYPYENKFYEYQNVVDKIYTAEKMTFSIKDIFRKCDHIRIESFIFCEVIGGHKTIECDKENHHTQKERQLQL